MKNRKYYYTQNKHLAPNSNIDNWLQCKDRFWKWVTTDYIQGVFGIELRPKRRHIRSIAKRDLCHLMRGCCIDYYENKYCKPHRVTIITKPTWEWYLDRRTNDETKRV